ncbi:ODV-E56 [Homarus gammarus nudivirus]|uniref:ODV-E56 n=1 Tax=Homarus gammarus nudivirus TaxID=2509616 RepID=A0A411HB31_9VIRU|nr:ODV-E56 [Homarus gammarus nudivirus]QBB28611.1 ODV-E56 [Homarus gammarus nudivirus]
MHIKWLDDIGKGSIPIKEAEDFTNAVDVIKGADSGVVSIDNALSNLDYKHVGDEIHVGDARFRDMEVDLRKGNVKKALEDANVPSTITSADESLLKKTLNGGAPDIDIATLDSKISQAKKFHEDLNVTAKDGADLESKLSPKSKEKAKSMYSKITKVVGVGFVASGIFAAVLITGNVWNDLADAANSMNGCFIAYKNTDTVACKITARSCGFSTGGATACATEVMKKTQYNIYLMVHDLINSGDTTSIEALKTNGCVWADDATAEDVLGNSANIPILVSYYTTKYPTYDAPAFNPCELGGIVKGCVACDSSLTTEDLGYSSSETLDSNMIYKCILNTSVIEAVTDIVTDLGIDIFNASGDSISGSFQGNFLMSVIVILVLIAIVALVIKFIPNRSKKTTPTVSELDKNSNVPPPPTPAV